MVFFTCNRCGESLKKNKVELHRCKPFHLTCVDCLKDFGSDYVKHMGCISEKDRYSAAGLSGMPLKKTKQQLWLEAARDCCSKAIDDNIPGLTRGILDLLKYLLEAPVIPDKFPKFTNALISARREPKENIAFVWKLLEKPLADVAAKLKAEREAAVAEARKKKEEKMKNKKQDSSDSSSSDSDSEDDEKSKAPTNGMNEVPSQVVQSKSEKKKKRMMSESESVINGTSETRKVKKSKKNPKTDESEDSSNLNNALNACHLNGVVEEKLSKKEKKERKKREKYEAELKTLESVKPTDETEPQDEPMEEVAEETETKMSKKKKKKAELKNLESVEDEPIEEVVEETETKKGKKKKNKKNAEEIVPVDEELSDTKDKKKEKKSKKQQRQDEAERIYAEKPDKKGKTDKLENGKLNATLKLDEDNGAEFSWDTAILQVLESQSDHEVSLKKLSKKVLNEYLLSVGDDAYVDEAKIINKFHKKLQKMHNVLVHKDKVRLKTSRD